MLKEKYAKAEDQAGLPSGAGEGEDTRQGSEHEKTNREIFEDDGQLDSAAAQSADALMEVAGILAGGRLDDLEEDELSNINNPLIRAKLAGIIQGKKAEQQSRADLEARRQAWDEQMHDFGGRRLKGSEINAAYDWFSKKENQDILRKKLKSEGKTDPEIDDAFSKVAKRKELWQKMRDGTATDEEKRHYQELGKDPNVVRVESEAQREMSRDKKTALDSHFDTNDMLAYRRQSAESAPSTEESRSAAPETSPDGYAVFRGAPRVGEKFTLAASDAPATPANQATPTPPSAAKVEASMAML